MYFLFIFLYVFSNVSMYILNIQVNIMARAVLPHFYVVILAYCGISYFQCPKVNIKGFTSHSTVRTILEQTLYISTCFSGTHTEDRACDEVTGHGYMPNLQTTRQ